MCRIEQRRYTYADGSRSAVFEVEHLCRNATPTHTCNRVTTDNTVTEVHLSSPAHLPSLRDDAPSPASLNPPTPPTGGTILIQERRPASIERRPSTKEHRGTRYIKPEIILDFSSKKGRDKKYKRSSLGNVSIASSNDVNIDSPTSRASYSPIRTGFPEAPLPPPASTGPYSTIPVYPTAHPTHHRHTSSASSYGGSGYNPTLYSPSEPPSSPTSNRRSTRQPVSLHQPQPPAPSRRPPSPSVSTAPPSPNPYHTTIVTPRTSNSTATSASTGAPNFPLDYAQFIPPSSNPIFSYPPGATTTRDARDARDASRKRQQEAADEALAAELQAKEAEQARLASLELARFTEREKLRNEQRQAESEKTRAEERELARQARRKEQEKRDAEYAAKVAREEREKEQRERDRRREAEYAAELERKEREREREREKRRDAEYAAELDRKEREKEREREKRRDAEYAAELDRKEREKEREREKRRDAEYAAELDRKEREKERERERDKESRTRREQARKPTRLDEEIARRKRQLEEAEAKLAANSASASAARPTPSRRDSRASNPKPKAHFEDAPPVPAPKPKSAHFDPNPYDGAPPPKPTSKRHSLSTAVYEHERALAETAAFMESERLAAAQRERDERAHELRALQQRPEYWSPRAEMRSANIYNAAVPEQPLDAPRPPSSGMRSRRSSFTAPPPPPPPVDEGFGLRRRSSMSGRRPALSVDTAPSQPQPQPHGPPPSRSAYAQTQAQPPGSPGLGRKESLRQRGARVIAEAQEKAAAEERARERGKALRAAQGLAGKGSGKSSEEDDVFGPSLRGGRRRGA